MRILCWLGVHRDAVEIEAVFKSEFAETNNTRLVCKRCGRKTEWVGNTFFSLGEFEL